MNRELKLTQIYEELLESQTSKKIFLEKIEKIIPWDEWLGISNRSVIKESVEISPMTLNLC